MDMNFSGMLNSHGGWKGWDDHHKYVRVEMLQRGFFRPGKFMWRDKYQAYSRTQPDNLFRSARDWNYGRTRQNKLFTLFPWRK